MNLVDGIGGAFLFSNDVKKLAEWYRDCLGVIPAGEEIKSHVYRVFESRDLANPEIKKSIAWAILPADEDLKGKPRTGKINYTVKSMSETLSHLKSKGVAIEKAEEHSYGKFATIKDPEGNLIELWEPSEGE